jgi:hypothetical protein
VENQVAGGAATTKRTRSVSQMVNLDDIEADKIIASFYDSLMKKFGESNLPPGWRCSDAGCRIQGGGGGSSKSEMLEAGSEVGGSSKSETPEAGSKEGERGSSLLPPKRRSKRKFVPVSDTLIKLGYVDSSWAFVSNFFQLAGTK